jgi:hypothetical protein
MRRASARRRSRRACTEQSGPLAAARRLTVGLGTNLRRRYEGGQRRDRAVHPKQESADRGGIKD